MSKIARLVVLILALASLLGLVSSTACAVHWHNTGSTAFTATAGAPTLSVTGSGGTNPFACQGSRATGSAPATQSGAIFGISTTINFSPCLLAGNTMYIHCQTGTLTGTAQPPAGVTTGIADLTCVARLAVGNTALCHIAGTVPFDYTNAETGPPGRLTITGAGAKLTVTPAVTHSSCSILLGSNTSGTGHLTEFTYTVTAGTGGSGVVGPTITRTA